MEVNTAPLEALLRVPGIGVRGANLIVRARRTTCLREPELRKLGIDHELLDYRAAPRECLPHNYIVGMPWLKETREAVESMLSFFAEHMAPRMSLNASE